MAKTGEIVDIFQLEKPGEKNLKSYRKHEKNFGLRIFFCCHLLKN